MKLIKYIAVLLMFLRTSGLYAMQTANSGPGGGYSLGGAVAVTTNITLLNPAQVVITLSGTAPWPANIAATYSYWSTNAVAGYAVFTNSLTANSNVLVYAIVQGNFGSPGYNLVPSNQIAAGGTSFDYAPPTGSSLAGSWSDANSIFLTGQLLATNAVSKVVSFVFWPGQAAGVSYQSQAFVNGVQYPEITFSPIGFAAGCIVPNNGAMFGPDTPGTMTCGIQEAWNLLQPGTNYYRYDLPGATFNLWDGTFGIYTNIVFSCTNPFVFHMEGNSILGTRLLYEPTVTNQQVDVIRFANGNFLGPGLNLPWEIKLNDFTVTPIQEIPYTTLIAVDQYSFATHGTNLYRQSSGGYSTLEMDDVNLATYNYTTNGTFATGNQLSIAGSDGSVYGNCTIGMRIRGGDDHQTLFNNCYFVGLANGLDASCDHLTMNDCKSAFVGGFNGGGSANWYKPYAIPGTLNAAGVLTTLPNYPFAYSLGAVVIHDGVVGPGLQWEFNHCHFYAGGTAVFDLGDKVASQSTAGDRFLDCEFEAFTGDSAGGPQFPTGDMVYDAGDGGSSNQTVVCPANSYVYPRLMDCSHGYGNNREAEVPIDVIYGWTNFFNNVNGSSSACWYGAAEALTSGIIPSEPRYQLWIGTNEVASATGSSNNGYSGPMILPSINIPATNNFVEWHINANLSPYTVPVFTMTNGQPLGSVFEFYSNAVKCVMYYTNATPVVVEFGNSSGGIL